MPTEDTQARETKVRVRQEEILAALEDLHSKLLDLTGHNPLLNCRHGKRSTRYLRIAAELSDQIVSSLFNGGSIEFGTVPRLAAVGNLGDAHLG